MILYLSFYLSIDLPIYARSPARKDLPDEVDRVDRERDGSVHGVAGGDHLHERPGRVHRAGATGCTQSKGNTFHTFLPEIL